jgi:ribosomal protein L11 methyltransferase
VQKTSCDATRGDVVLANIVAGTLIELTARLADIVRPGGRAVLAGLLVGQEAAVAEAYRTWFHIGAAARRDGWIRIEATRRA